MIDPGLPRETGGNKYVMIDDMFYVEPPCRRTYTYVRIPCGLNRTPRPILHQNSLIRVFRNENKKVFMCRKQGDAERKRNILSPHVVKHPQTCVLDALSFGSNNNKAGCENEKIMNRLGCTLGNIRRSSVCFHYFFLFFRTPHVQLYMVGFNVHFEIS